MSKPIYLDYAAATPLDGSVLAAMTPYFTDKFYNPSALYLHAKAVHADITDARERIARILGSKPSEIIFTAGGTEANNLAVNGVLDAFPGSNAVVSSIEHDSVLIPAQKRDGKTIAVDTKGVIDLVNLKDKINDKTVLVSVMYANNEIGSVQPIKEVTRIVSEIKSERLKAGNSLPLYVHTDAAQATNYLDIHTSRLGVDLMTINGGKIYGPKQTGLLFVKTGTKVSAQTLGGGQERGLRSGTENVSGVIGFARALEVVTERKKDEVARLKSLQTIFINELSTIPGVSVNGSLKHRLPNNVHITVAGADNERLMMELDERGIMCATGSACSASSDEPSHVLAAIGMTEADAQSSLRFSMGVATSESDVQTVVSALASITKAL